METLSKKEQNIKDVKLHYQLRKLNEVKFRPERLSILTSIEVGYMERNESLIFDDPYYKELLENHETLPNI